MHNCALKSKLMSGLSLDSLTLSLPKKRALPDALFKNMLLAQSVLL